MYCTVYSVYLQYVNKIKVVHHIATNSETKLHFDTKSKRFFTFKCVTEAFLRCRVAALSLVAMLENSCQPSSECQKAIYDGYIYIAFINSSGQILGVVRKDRKSEPVDSFF